MKITHKKQIVFVVAAYNPPITILITIQELLDKINSQIIVIDDGSITENANLINKIGNKNDRVTVLRHAVNMGKGAALKTAFNFLLLKHPRIHGVVTLDADGQHSVDDCIKVHNALLERPNRFVLGYRNFTKTIPFRSFIGNQLSVKIYNFLLGRKFKDTQTGLRGLCRNFMKQSLSIKSNRFEFETEQLVLAVKSENNNMLQIVEVPIETIYSNNNKTSTFRPILDSLSIYITLLRYTISSIATFIVDFTSYIAVMQFTDNILLANILARTFAIITQFTLLNKFVFSTKSTSNYSKFLKYCLYVYVVGYISSLLQNVCISDIGLNIIASKLIVEGVLYLWNFSFLRTFIFNRNQPNENMLG